MGEPINDIRSVWDCRWSHLGYRLTGVREQQPESVWICIRQADSSRPVSEEECAHCEFWEPSRASKQ